MQVIVLLDMLFEEFINELLILIMMEIRRLLTCDVSVLLCNDEGLIKRYNYK